LIERNTQLARVLEVSTIPCEYIAI